MKRVKEITDNSSNSLVWGHYNSPSIINDEPSRRIWQRRRMITQRTWIGRLVFIVYNFNITQTQFLQRIFIVIIISTLLLLLLLIRRRRRPLLHGACLWLGGKAEVAWKLGEILVGYRDWDWKWKKWVFVDLGSTNICFRGRREGDWGRHFW